MSGSGRDSANSTISLKGEDIICFTHTPWHGPWKASQQLMSLLAESNRVLYVGPPIALRDAINRFGSRAQPRPILDRVAPTLFIYNEPRFLARIRGSRPLGKVYNQSTAWARVIHVRYLARRLGFKRPVLWVFDPMQARVVGLFREEIVVYHVLDNYVEFMEPRRTVERADIACNEERMLKHADVVFAVSRPLHERCLKCNSQSFLVPNGVNYDWFQTAIASASLPLDLKNIRRPIIGYVGVIQGDMDFPLLHRLALEAPNTSVVLVGPEELGDDRSKLEALLAHANVHYLGAKLVEDVPGYISACDVCILPSIVNRAAAESDHIKPYEYLACGRPVVSTALPSVQRFSHVVRIARNAEEFLVHVRASLEENSSWSELRKRVARQESWQHRVATLSEILVERMPSHAREMEGTCELARR